MEFVFRLLDEEGLYVGASSALNVAAAAEMAKKLGPGIFNSIYLKLIRFIKGIIS